jgi:hypothetical protein
MSGPDEASTNEILTWPEFDRSCLERLALWAAKNKLPTQWETSGEPVLRLGIKHGPDMLPAQVRATGKSLLSIVEDFDELPGGEDGGVLLLLVARLNFLPACYKYGLNGQGGICCSTMLPRLGGDEEALFARLVNELEVGLAGWCEAAAKALEPDFLETPGLTPTAKSPLLN